MLGELSQTELMDYANELENKNQELKETNKELYEQKNYFMRLNNNNANTIKEFHNNLIDLIISETDIKELKRAFEYIRNLKIKGTWNANALKDFEKKLNNETIYNLCLLLVRH